MIKTFLRRVAGADVARNSVIVLIAILLGNVGNYAYYVLMGRALSLRDYGTIMSLVSLILLVLGIGTIVQTTIAKLAADLRAAGDERPIAAFVRLVFRWSLISCFVILVGAVILRNALSQYLRVSDNSLAMTAGAAAAFGFAVLFQRGLFQGFGQFRTFSLSMVLDGAKAFYIFPLTRALGSFGAILAVLFTTAVETVYGTIVLWPRLRVYPGGATLDLRRLLRTGSATGIASMSFIVLMFYDVVLAKHYIDALQAGLYSAAALAGRMLLAACGFLPIVLLPDVALRSASGRPDRHILAATLAVAGFIVALIVGACAFAPRLVLTLLAGHAFASAAPLLLPYVSASAALAVANLLAMYSIARHRFGFIPYVLLIAVAEIVAVTVRHNSSLAIVQDILAGHSAIFIAIAGWVAVDLARIPTARAEAAPRSAT